MSYQLLVLNELIKDKLPAEVFANIASYDTSHISADLSYEIKIISSFNEYRKLDFTEFTNCLKEQLRNFSASKKIYNDIDYNIKTIFNIFRIFYSYCGYNKLPQTVNVKKLVNAYIDKLNETLEINKDELTINHKNEIKTIRHLFNNNIGIRKLLN